MQVKVKDSQVQKPKTKHRKRDNAPAKQQLNHKDCYSKKFQYQKAKYIPRYEYHKLEDNDDQKNEHMPTEPEIKRFRFCVKVDSIVSKKYEAKVLWDKAKTDLFEEEEFRLFSEANLKIHDSMTYMQPPKVIAGFEVAKKAEEKFIVEEKRITEESVQMDLSSSEEEEVEVESGVESYEEGRTVSTGISRG